MNQIEEIRIKLEKLKPVLKKQYQVETIGFFGSYARGEQNKRSDVDILVEFRKPNTIDLFDFIELEEFLSKQLGIKVDLVTKSALKPLIKDQILKETIYAWKEPTETADECYSCTRLIECFKWTLLEFVHVLNRERRKKEINNIY